MSSQTSRPCDGRALAVRQQGAGQLLFAAPVAAAAGLEAMIRKRADVVRCLCELPAADFRTVSHWYEDFSPPSEAAVLALLERAATTGSV